MIDYKNIKFKVGLPVIVKLLKDEPEEKKGKYGMFNEYTAEFEGEEYKFIAAEGLHNSLLEYKKGDILEIIKVEGDAGKSYFEVEQLEEKDIKSTEQSKQYPEPDNKDWDKINADKDYLISLTVTLKIAVASMPIKPKLTDKDYEEIEVRMVKFNAIRNKYLGVTMPVEAQNKPKFSPLVQAKWNEFDKYLTENKDTLKTEDYKKTRAWLDGLKDPTTKVLTEQLSKLKGTLETSKYAQYHESLITACCETLKIKDRLPIIQTLDIMVKKWDIDGTEELSDTTENQCLNLLEEFDKQQVVEQEDGLPY